LAELPSTQASCGSLYLSFLTFKSDLLKLDWAAIGAIATDLSAMFTAWAAWAATRAANAAIGIDRRHSREHRRQTERRAIATAVALRTELQKLSGLGKRISAFPLLNDQSEIDVAVQALLGTRDMVSAPLLEKFADRFSDFDLATAAQLTQTLAVVLEFRRNVPLSDRFSMEHISQIVRTFRDSGRTLRHTSVLAQRRLGQYTRKILHKYPPGS
jgi:hypothetical protein